MLLARGLIHVNVIHRVEDDEGLITVRPKGRDRDWAAKVLREDILQGKEEFQINGDKFVIAVSLGVVIARDARLRSDFPDIESADGARELESDTRPEAKISLRNMAASRRSEQVGASDAIELEFTDD